VGGIIATFISTGHLVLTSATLSIPGIIVSVIGAIIAVFIWHRVMGRAV